jgi:hypothetical protein
MSAQSAAAWLRCAPACISSSALGRPCGVNVHLASIPPPRADLSRQSQPHIPLACKCSPERQAFGVGLACFLFDHVVRVDDEADQAGALQDQVDLCLPSVDGEVARNMEERVILRRGQGEQALWSTCRNWRILRNGKDGPFTSTTVPLSGAREASTIRPSTRRRKRRIRRHGANFRREIPDRRGSPAGIAWRCECRFSG